MQLGDNVTWPKISMNVTVGSIIKIFKLMKSNFKRVVFAFLPVTAKLQENCRFLKKTKTNSNCDLLRVEYFSDK